MMCNMRPLDPAARAQLAVARDRARRRARIAFVCVPLGFLPVTIAAALVRPVPSDGDVIALALATFAGVLGVIPICLKIALDSSRAATRIGRFLDDGIAGEPQPLPGPRAWAHIAALLIALFHNPMADFRRAEKCFGLYAVPWWIVATSLFFFLECVMLYAWWRSQRARRTLRTRRAWSR